MSERNSEARIRELIKARVNAVRNKDVAAAISNCAADIVSFDVVNPLQRIGLDEAKGRAEEWFTSFPGPIDFEISELSITTSERLAFSHSLNHVRATNHEGVTIDMWWRATACYQELDGNWMIVHEHQSVPFEAKTGKASLDLKP